MYTVLVTGEHVYIVDAVSSRTALKFREFYEYTLPKSAISNGVLLEPDSFVEILTQARQTTGPRMKSCGLVIDSSLIYSKRLELPKLKKAEQYKLVRNEFIHIETQEEPLLIEYTHPGVQRTGQNQTVVIAYAMRRSLIAPYIRAFSSAGIRLDFIDAALNAFIKLMEKNSSLSSGNVMMTLISGNSMTSVMFDHGAFEFSNRMQLSAAQDSGEFSNALLQNLSSLIRFFQTQKKPDPLSTIYIGGLWEQQRQLCENLSRILELDVIPDIPIEGFTPSDGVLDVNTDQIIYALGSAVER